MYAKLTNPSGFTLRLGFFGIVTHPEMRPTASFRALMASCCLLFFFFGGKPLSLPLKMEQCLPLLLCVSFVCLVKVNCVAWALFSCVCVREGGEVKRGEGGVTHILEAAGRFISLEQQTVESRRQKWAVTQWDRWWESCLLSFHAFVFQY